MKLLFLDLCPTYIPFLVQCTEAAGAAINPTVDNLIVYEETGADGTFDATTITGSPFDPAQINSKTGLWGVLIAKSAFTAGRFYIALWEMTVDGVATAKTERYFACNASQFKADVSGLSTFDPSSDEVDIGSVKGAGVSGVDDFKADVSALALQATLEDAGFGLSALKDLLDAIDTSTELQARFTEIKGAGWATETLKAIKDAVDAIEAGNAPTVQEIVAAILGNLSTGVFQSLITVTEGTPIKVTRGDYLPAGTITFNFGSKWNCTDKKVYFCVKSDKKGTKLIDVECILTDPANGIGHVGVLDLEKETLPAADYYYEFERVENDASKPITPRRGKFIIEQDLR